MENFPSILTPDNKNNFNKVYTNYYRNKLRKSIFLNILGNDETSYFDIDTWIRESNFDNKKVDIQSLLEPILLELKQLKWNYTFSYGKTALFIHENEKPPINCYNDEFQ